MIVLLILLLIVIVVFAFTRQVKEHYNNLDNTLLSHVYQRDGIERCDAIYADIATKPETRDNLTAKSLETMDNYVLGFRAREWVPADTKMQKALDPTKKYCYMMYDSNHNAIDPILEHQHCDMRNPIFQNVPFIERIYTDSTADISHTMPYTKCVMQVDPEKVDASSLNKFWSRMGETQCAQYQAKNENKVTNLVGQLSALSNEYYRFLDLDPQFKDCKKEQAQLENTLSAYNREYALSNCAFTGNCDGVSPEGSLVMMKKEYETLINQLNQSQEFVTNLDTDISKTQKNVKDDQRKFNEQSIILTSLTTANTRCTNVDVPERTAEYTEMYDELQRIYNSTNIAKQQLATCRSESASKKREYEKLMDTLTKTQAAYTGSNNMLITCLTTCDYLRQTIATLKDQVQKVATQCNECTSAVITATAEAESLQKEVDGLVIERDDWLRRCTYDQKRMIDYSIETINNLRQSSSAYTRQNCGNDMTEASEVNDLIQKKFQALAALNSPAGCEETKRKDCCQRIGRE